MMKPLRSDQAFRTVAAKEGENPEVVIAKHRVL